MGETGTRADKARRATRTVFAASASAARAGAGAASGASRIVHRLTGASGAGRTGLSNLIELTAASSLGDAFVAVALAGTLFFSASVDQARGRIALALVITMAPFAVLAPFIGPMLDRVQQGRRYILAGTLLARGLLCWGMAGAVAHNDTLTLLPAAFGVLVLQKAFGVTRSAVAPRLLPAEITLVTANARAALASLVATTLGAGLAAGVTLAAGGGDSGAGWVLRAGTVVYLFAMVLGLRLPGGVDAPQPVPADQAVTQPAAVRAGPGRAAGPGGPGRAGRPGGSDGQAGGPGRAGGGEARPGGAGKRPADRIRWRTLSRVGPVVSEAMRANATLRAFSGFMIFFLAFLLRTEHFGSVPDKVALGEMIVAAGVGGFAGTAIGSALKARAPQVIVFVMLGFASITTALCAVFFGLWAALIVAAVAALGQALVKLAMDATVQREIGEEIRSSAFAASETLHQLSWVAGGLAGLLLSLTGSGVAGLTVAAAGLWIALAALLVVRRRRVVDARRTAAQARLAPGSS
ncbi:MAG TPA: MFS transporter [Streptosporangiaceae bacterium]|jgi:MFS family permease